MSDITTLKSYLVSLGFDANMAQFRNNFEKPLQMASSLVKKETFSIAGDILGWQLKIVGFFVGISTGVMATMDKVAMADQQYRLFGERMFMNTAHARDLKIALNALGEPLNAIAFDPELHERFMQLVEDQKEMTKGIGPDFEENMRKIRDVRFQVTRLKVELQYLAMGATNSLFKAFGASSGDLLTNLQHLNNWIINNIPYLSNQFAVYLMPILKSTGELIKQIWSDLKLASAVFDNFVGIVSGDTSIEGQTASFEKFAGAIEHVINWLRDLARYIGQAEGMMLHLMDAAADGLQGKYAAAASELRQAFGVLNAGNGVVTGAAIGSAIGSIVPGAGTAAGGAVGAAVGGLAGEIAGGTGLRHNAVKMSFVQRLMAFIDGPGSKEWEAAGYDSNLSSMPGLLDAGNKAKQLMRDALYLAIKVSKQTGIPANLIFDQWDHETNDFTNRGALALNNFAGIKLSGTNKYRDFANPSSFASYFSQLLQSPRYASHGILQAKTIDQYAAALKAGGYYSDSFQHYANGMQYREQEHHTTQLVINVGDINIQQPNASAREIQDSVVKGIEKAQGKLVARLFPQIRGSY